MLTLGIAQLPCNGNLKENLESILEFATIAKENGCSAVCFPECALTGYSPEHAASQAIPHDDDSLQTLSSFAFNHSIDLIVGFMERHSDVYHITHGIFRADGTKDFYRKSHLGQKEQLYFTPGNHLLLFSLSCGLTVGFQLCMETHFPEISQTLALRGAELIFAPHAVPKVSGDRKKIWTKYIPSRSYDNRVYVACCNQCDSDRFGGGCLVTDPRGEVLTSYYEETPHLLTFTVDRDLVSRYRTPGDKRSTHYYPSRRRTELYD